MIDASPKPMYINGEWVFAEGGATFDVINPADQSTVASIANGAKPEIERAVQAASAAFRDRKSTRLNSSHSQISYAVFCLKKKKKNTYDNCVGFDFIKPITLAANRSAITRLSSKRRCMVLVQDTMHCLLLFNVSVHGTLVV